MIALDTPPEPADTVDITFATDNFKAGTLIGQWAAAQLDGEKAVIALLDDFTDKIVTVDYRRDQGFLTGMGIDTADPEVQRRRGADRHATPAAPEVSTRSSATSRPVAASTAAAPRWRTASPATPTSTSCTRSTSPPPAAPTTPSTPPAPPTASLIVSVDGGCAGVQLVADGVIGATAQQYPLDMASLGVEAIADIVRGGEPPAVTEGLDFFDTGVALVTDKPVEGLDSIDTDAGPRPLLGLTS